MGCGQVRTEHGLLPVPAPATANILEGYPWRSDSISGERVTPTGAAIVRHLVPRERLFVQPAGILSASGYGAGTKYFPELPNVLRVLVFDAGCQYALTMPSETIAMIQFNIDDMSGEEIGIAAERLRKAQGVLELLLIPVQGEKERSVTMFQMVVVPELCEKCCDLIFLETSTVGLRWSVMERKVLPRRSVCTNEDLSADKFHPNGNFTTKLESEAIDTVLDLANRPRSNGVAEELKIE